MENNNQQVSGEAKELGVVHTHIQGWLVVILILIVGGAVVFYEYNEKQNSVVKPLVNTETPKTNFNITKDNANINLPKEVIPVDPVSSQYWDSATAKGGLFIVKGKVSDALSSYEKTLKTAEWKILNKNVATEQTSLYVSDKTGQTFASIDISKGLKTDTVVINIRMQK
jgi:hypothetical protein